MLPRKFRRTEAGDDLEDDYEYQYGKETESSGKMDEGSGKQQVSTERESILINLKVIDHFTDHSILASADLSLAGEAPVDIKPAEDNYNDPEMLGHGHGHGHSHGHGEEGDTTVAKENSGDDTSESITESEGSTER